MFSKTAEYYDALYHFKDYEAACNKLIQLIRNNHSRANSLLDVACGTGKHLEFLQHQMQVSGLDLDENLLKVARRRCPLVPLFHEDMTDFHLNTCYDAVVCLFSSIAYVRTLDNLNRTIQRMAEHLNPGGILLVEPWIFPENYWVKRITANFVDQSNLKIAWMYTSELDGLTSVFDIQYMVGTPEGVEKFSEQHIMGLWTDQEYRQAFLNAGINPVFDEKGLFGRGMYYGIKKA
jgi:SAM-dependent methyltransferase